MICDICGCDGATDKTVLRALNDGRTLSIYWSVCKSTKCLEEIRRI